MFDVIRDTEGNVELVRIRSNAEKVSEFHTAMGMTNGVWPPTFHELELRESLISEEWRELWNEMFHDHDQELLDDQPPLNKQKLAKELADLLYVTYGTAVSFGIPIDEVFDAVHRSNMSKLVDGKPLLREDGKVLKGPNYQPPQLEFIFK